MGYTPGNSLAAAAPHDEAVAEVAARLALALSFPAGAPASQDPVAQLFRAVLQLVLAHADLAAQRYRLYEPLSRVVTTHRTRAGQQRCADLAAALKRGDAAASLDACKLLGAEQVIELRGFT